MDLLESLGWRAVPHVVTKIAQQHHDELHKIAAAWTTDDFDRHLKTFFRTLRLAPGRDVMGLPAKPNPLVSTLLGGMVGTGLGYTAGALGERFLPPDWKKNRLRRTAAIVGGLAGASPGLAFTGLNALHGLAPWSDKLWGGAWREAAKAEPLELAPEAETAIKQAMSSGAFGPISVPVDEFNRVVWGDRRVSSLLSPAEKGAITGLVSGAAHLPGKLTNSLVTPLDVGRMAAGMGSGYLSGAIVGKGLATLVGAPPQTQERLKNTGLWAGAIKGMLPLVF